MATGVRVTEIAHSLHKRGEGFCPHTTVQGRLERSMVSQGFTGECYPPQEKGSGKPLREDIARVSVIQIRGPGAPVMALLYLW
jgi:hypothetical protein